MTNSSADTIFIIPPSNDIREHIVYAPLKNIAFICNENAVTIAKNIINGEKLTQRDIDSVVYKYVKQINEFPTQLPITCDIGDVSSAVIILSQQCNLSCSYCFSQQSRSVGLLDVESVEAVIDYTINSESINKKFIFIGGGEPFLAWEDLKRAIQYIHLKKNINHKVLIVITTNATLLDDKKILFLNKYGVELGISFDILPEIQNSQRCFANQKGTFTVVDNYIRQLIKNNIKIRIRSTITSHNVAKMAEMVQFVVDNYSGIKYLHFEPVSDSQDNTTDFYTEFVSNFISARRLGLQYGVDVYNSVTNSIDKLNSRFCRGEFCTTPTGEIVACHRVSSKEDPLFEKMYYGKVANDRKSLNIDDNRKNEIFAMFNKKLPECKNCFAMWHCAGGCVYDQNNLTLSQLRAKCYYIKSLIQAILYERLTIKTNSYGDK